MIFLYFCFVLFRFGFVGVAAVVAAVVVGVVVAVVVVVVVVVLPC